MRICADVVGAYAFEHRKDAHEVVPRGGGSLLATRCEACGQCVSACPTAALVENAPSFAREEKNLIKLRAFFDAKLPK